MPDGTQAPALPSQNNNQPQKTTKFTREKTQRQDVRATVPAKVVSGEGDSYSMLLYPNGSDGESISATVTNLNPTSTLNVGDWVLVFRHQQLEIKTTEWVKKDAEGDEQVISTQTEITIKATHNETVGSAGGNSGVFAGKVTAGGGSTYTVDAYLKGVSAGSPTSVTVSQLDIDAAETIPNGTWALISKEPDGQYIMQVPVILNDG